MDNAKKFKVEICLGTTCYVLGAAELAELEEYLPEELADRVDVCGCNCLGLCKNRNFGSAPFVRVDGKEILAKASIDSIIECLKRKLGEVKNDQ